MATGDVLWADMVPDLTPHLPDCPVFMIEGAIKDAAQRLYRNTRSWRVDEVDLGWTFSGESQYQATPPVGLEMIGLPRVWINGELVDELAFGESSSTSTAADDYATSPMRVGVTGPDTFTIIPAPTEDNWTILGTVAYAPADDCVGIPGYLWRRDREAIQSAALADIQSHAGKPWSASSASQHDAKARVEALRLSTEGGARRQRLRVTPY